MPSNNKMSKSLQFSCGCKFPIIGDKDGEPLIDFDPINQDLNFDCQKTWSLISDGNTKGCFQLESRLGRSMAKKLKPTNIEQLSALISIMRPGSLEAYRDGKSISNHYIDKKNGQESLDYFHSSLEPALKSTYGEMIYQEQAMQIVQTIAGFDLQEADMLRKAIGKKKPEEMAKIKKKFISGAKKINILNKEQAEEVFSWIEKSQRYSFNKSILDNTSVVTQSGNKTIKDLKTGEKILAPTKDRNEYVTVLDKYDHGEQEVFKITLANNATITCTMEHKFLCSDGNIYPLSEILLNNLEIMCI